jgi:hypothetical protein
MVTNILPQPQPKENKPKNENKPSNKYGDLDLNRG